MSINEDILTPQQAAEILGLFHTVRLGDLLLQPQAEAAIIFSGFSKSRRAADGVQ